MKLFDKSQLVYRTDGGRTCPKCNCLLIKCDCKTSRLDNQLGITKVNIRKERKGRAGKIVTIIDGLSIDPEELKSVAKILKKKSGVGGSVKDQRIEIQGDQREKCFIVLKSLGYPVKPLKGN